MTWREQVQPEESLKNLAYRTGLSPIRRQQTKAALQPFREACVTPEHLTASAAKVAGGVPWILSQTMHSDVACTALKEMLISGTTTGNRLVFLSVVLWINKSMFNVFAICKSRFL